MESYRIREIQPADWGRVAERLVENWGSLRIVSRGRIYQLDQLPGFLAEWESPKVEECEDNIVGLVTYRLETGACEVTSLDGFIKGQGIGSALLKAVEDAARDAGCRRLWLITTNDNTHALRFYQRRGLHLAALYPNAIEGSRCLKPEIPLLGLDGIPIRDEIELEMILAD